jgi:large subunit ribosomal protein L9
MRLLLLEDVRKLGHVGDIVEVKAGFARNYLLPERLAAEPTEANIKGIEEKRKVASAERAKRLREFGELAERMKDVSITIEVAANPEGTLYGAIREKDIADALHGQGFPVRAEHVLLEAPIRTLDNRVVRLEFTEEITVPIKLWVVREGGGPDELSTAEPGPGEPGANPDADEPEEDQEP